MTYGQKKFLKMGNDREFIMRELRFRFEMFSGSELQDTQMLSSNTHAQYWCNNVVTLYIRLMER